MRENLTPSQRIIKDMTDTLKRGKQRLVFKEIIDIYQGVYGSYDFYNEIKKKQIDIYIKRREEGLICSKGFDNSLSMTMYVEPVVISKEDFEMIRNIAEEDKRNK